MSLLVTTEPETAVEVRLLVVDDDDVDRERVVRMVGNSGMRAVTTEAASSREAIALLQAQEFDCVVLDNHLPDGSGAEILAALGAAARARSPVIMVTGAGDEELAASVMRAGAADYLPKSRLSADNLFQAISRSVASWRLQQQLDHYAADLAVSEAKYRALVEDQTELVSLAEPDLTLSYVNTAYAAHYGLAPEQMVGHNLLEFLPADEREPVAAQMRMLCRRKSVERSENRTMSAVANVTRWVAWTHRALLDKIGSVVSIHSVGRDVTDQVHGREAVARLAAVVNCSVDAVLSTNLQGEITTWNPAAERLFEHPAYHAIGKPIGLILPPDREVEERTLGERVRNGESIVEFETVRMRGNGRLVEVSLTFSQIRDGYGRLCGISQAVRDIRGRKRLERALIDSERQYRDLYESTPALLHSTDVTGCLLSVSDAWLAQMGYLRNEVVGRPLADFLAPESQQITQEILPALLQGGRVEELACRLVRCNGTLIDVLLSATLERDESGNPRRALAVLQDVTEKNRLAKAVEEEHARLRVTLRSIGDAVVTTDKEGLVEYLNPVAEHLTGWPLEEARGRPIAEVFQVVHEESRRPIENPAMLSLSQDRIVGLPDRALLLARDGNEYGIEDSSAPIRDLEGRSLGSVLVFHDVTAQRRMTMEMNFRACHDALTGLVNRSEFEDRLQRALARYTEAGVDAVLLYIDLDQFKLVNDACGHSVGDQLLRQIGGVLQRCVRSRDTLARLGGDEFAVILESCSLEQAQRVAQQICERVEEFRFVHEERRFRLGASIGLVPASERWPTAAALLQAADSCCYAAKEAGRNRVHSWFDADPSLRVQGGETQWASRIESALEDDRFVLYAQRIAPIGDPAQADMHCEVLLRMLDVDGTVVPPGAILPAAERFHMVSRIDRWVLRRVFEWMERNASALEATSLIAVNLSGQSLGDRAFHRYVEDLIHPVGFDVRKLCFEVTESAAITNLEDATDFIARMRALGVRIALDDFGAGASSFGYLKSLPVDFLKIDGQFVRGVVDKPLDQVAVRCFRDVAAVLGVKTIAEFVENAAILDFLRDAGIDYAQGYLVHQPEPIDSLFATQGALLAAAR